MFKLPDDGKEIVTTLQINDMFLLGMSDEDINFEKPNYELFANHLYRVQKLSSKFYEFRLVREATLKNNLAPKYIRIQSFGKGKTGWKTFTPLKVRVSVNGRICKVH